MNQTFRNQDPKLLYIYICEKIAAIINKVYLNVIHNYFRDGTSKGRSKQREVIKRCLETFFQIIELQEVKQHQDNFLDTFSLFLLELDNVGKFPWISIKNDKLFNTTVFDALSFRSDLWKGIPKKEEYIDTVLAEIKINVAELQKNNRLETQVNKRFLTCCMIAYYNYNDERFIDLMKTLVSGDKLDTEKVKNVYIPNDKNKYDLENFLLEKGLQFDEISDISISNTSILHEADDEKNTPSIDKYYKESIKEGYRNYDISVDYFAKTIILFLNVSFDVLICRYYALEHVGLFNAIACIIIMGIICVYLSFELK